MLVYLQLSPVLIPFIIGIWYFKYIKNWKWLFYYVSYGVFNEIISVVLVKLGSKNTLYLNHIYTLVSFVLLSFFYQSVLKDFFPRKWFKTIVVSYILFFIVNIIFFQGISEYPSLTFSVFALLIIIFSLIYFYKVMVESKIIHIAQEPVIWLNSAIIISFTGNLFFFILFNYLLNYSLEFMRDALIFIHFINAVSYVLIAIGFIKAKKKHNIQ